MPKGAFPSKAVAITLVVLTAAAIAGIITMTILFEIQTSNLNMTAPPPWVPPTPEPKPDMRLPRNLIPDCYEISIQPFLHIQLPEGINGSITNQSLVFSGNSIVHFHCVKRTKFVFLQSKDLEVSGGLLMNADTREMIKVLKITHLNDNRDFLEISLGNALEAGGNYSLSLSFTGEISENLEALFVSTYQKGDPALEDDSDRQRFLAATNLEPTSARRVFPCFDEPDMKAVFHLSIVHRKGVTVLGNGAKKGSQTIDHEWERTQFFPTKKMSTYLFAFTVSEFRSIDTKYKNVDISIYARPEATAAGHCQYAANITGKILGFYEDFFEIDYQQNTLNQIALPDLEVAAMENWGLITYQEGNLLFEEGVSSLLHKEQILTIVAHELAHQWFGNLVTMNWWNNIWLNEGFATYMSFLAADRVEPTFKIKELSVLFNLHSAFEEDSLVSSHPLSPPAQEVETTLQIVQMFDAIAYCKGAAVLRMLADLVGETTFNKGIKRYLSDFMFKNTDPSDLWKYVQKAAHDDNVDHADIVPKLMDSWTTQTGYPVVTINTNIGHISQKHFLFNDSSESSLLWQVPVRYMTNLTSKTHYFTLETNSDNSSDFVSTNGEWFLANINCTGYYRVNYNLENWGRLLSQMETDKSRIPLMNRGQLIDDAFNLARAKLVDVTLALNSTRFLRNETEYIPWESAIRNLEYFVLMFDRSEVFGPMQAYLQRQVKNLYNYYKNETDNSEIPKDPTSQRSQVTAIWYACSNGLPDCVEMSSRMYAAWMDHEKTPLYYKLDNSTDPTPGPNVTIYTSINPNLRSVIYCQAVAAGGKEEWEFAWEMYQTTSDTSEKDRLRKALSCTKKSWLLNRYLDYTLDPEKIRLMDVASSICDVSRNVAGQALAWNFIRAHWDYVSQDGGPFLINEVTRRFSKQFELEELERFKTNYDLGAAARAVDQAIEQTRVNIKWVKEHKDIVLNWFVDEIVRQKHMILF